LASPEQSKKRQNTISLYAPKKTSHPTQIKSPLRIDPDLGTELPRGTEKPRQRFEQAGSHEIRDLKAYQMEKLSSVADKSEE
jgi:hypothetical protein